MIVRRARARHAGEAPNVTDDRPLLTTRMLGEMENALRAFLSQTLRRS
jgi:hypothetical protein